VISKEAFRGNHCNVAVLVALVARRKQHTAGQYWFGYGDEESRSPHRIKLLGFRISLADSLATEELWKQGVNCVCRSRDFKEEIAFILHQ
jgi:hypothetical protein